MATFLSSDDQNEDSTSGFNIDRKVLQRFERDIDGMEIATRFDRHLIRGLI